MYRMLREEQQEFKSLIDARGRTGNLALVQERTMHLMGGRRKSRNRILLLELSFACFNGRRTHEIPTQCFVSRNFVIDLARQRLSDGYGDIAAALSPATA